MKRRTALSSLALFAPIFAAPALVGCSGADEGPAPSTSSDQAPLAWVTPDTADVVRTGEPIELAVETADASAKVVHFVLDGSEVFACDPSAPEEDCRLGDTWRYTTILTAPGQHVLEAKLEGANGVISATRNVEVLDALPPGVEETVPFHPGVDQDVPATEVPSIDLGGASDTELGTRGYLDPNRSRHNVFGGVYWSVSNQRVGMTHPPSGSVSAAASCMKRYGRSIKKWADHYKVSRGSVVATAITESNCTDPRGSSDGLSSGPMQVTASTCSAITGLSRTTCRVRMYTQPDFSFQVGTRYMGSSYQVRQHHHDPPKIGAAYNAGSIRRYYGNRWHMLVTGNHLERWVGAYNAYRSWEARSSARSLEVGPGSEGLPADNLHDDDYLSFVMPSFDGAHVATVADLPADAAEGTTVFVGDFTHRDGDFYERAGGTWQATTGPATE